MARIDDFLEKHLGGHISPGWRFTLYGFNAMHVAAQIGTRRWGYICFHPPMRCFGQWWPWYIYLSPNATPWAATWGVGPGFDREAREGAPWRRQNLGHGFASEPLSYNEMQPPHLRKSEAE